MEEVDRMVDTGGFIWLTDVGDEDDVELGGGAQVLRTEKVFREDGECVRGEKVGIVHIVETTAAHGNRVLVTATFDLDDGDTLVIHGVAERIQHNDRPSFRGRLSVGGGTGKFKGRRGQAEVDVCNPKRWIVDPSP
jgi:hypothetical protein